MANESLDSKVLEFLASLNSDASISEIQEAIGASNQGVRNAIGRLVSRTRITKSPKVSGQRGERYYAASSTVKEFKAAEQPRLKVIFNDKPVPLMDMVKSWAVSGEIPDTDPFLNKTCELVLQLYVMGALNLLETEMRPINYAELKDIHNSLFKLAASLRIRLSFINSLINNDNLWNPATLPRDMILVEPDVGASEVLEIARSLGIRIEGEV